MLKKYFFVFFICSMLTMVFAKNPPEKFICGENFTPWEKVLNSLYWSRMKFLHFYKIPIIPDLSKYKGKKFPLFEIDTSLENLKTIGENIPLDPCGRKIFYDFIFDVFISLGPINYDQNNKVSEPIKIGFISRHYNQFLTAFLNRTNSSLTLVFKENFWVKEPLNENDFRVIRKEKTISSPFGKNFLIEHRSLESFRHYTEDLSKFLNFRLLQISLGENAPINVDDKIFLNDSGVRKLHAVKLNLDQKIDLIETKSILWAVQDAGSLDIIESGLPRFNHFQPDGIKIIKREKPIDTEDVFYYVGMVGMKPITENILQTCPVFFLDNVNFTHLPPVKKK